MIFVTKKSAGNSPYSCYIKIVIRNKYSSHFPIYLALISHFSSNMIQHMGHGTTISLKMCILYHKRYFPIQILHTYIRHKYVQKMHVFFMSKNSQIVHSSGNFKTLSNFVNATMIFLFHFKNENFKKKIFHVLYKQFPV